MESDEEHGTNSHVDDPNEDSLDNESTSRRNRKPRSDKGRKRETYRRSVLSAKRQRNMHETLASHATSKPTSTSSSSSSSSPYETLASHTTSSSSSSSSSRTSSSSTPSPHEAPAPHATSNPNTSSSSSCSNCVFSPTRFIAHEKDANEKYTDRMTSLQLKKLCGLHTLMRTLLYASKKHLTKTLFSEEDLAFFKTNGFSFDTFNIPTFETHESRPCLRSDRVTHNYSHISFVLPNDIIRHIPESVRSNIHALWNARSTLPTFHFSSPQTMIRTEQLTHTPSGLCYVFTLHICAKLSSAPPSSRIVHWIIHDIFSPILLKYASHVVFIATNTFYNDNTNEYIVPWPLSL